MPHPETTARREALLQRLRDGDLLVMTPAGYLWNGDAKDPAPGQTVHAAIAARVVRVHGRAVVLS